MTPSAVSSRPDPLQLRTLAVILPETAALCRLLFLSCPRLERT